MKRLLVAAACLTIALAGAANAQIKRTPLQKFDVPGTSYETVIGIAELPPNAMIGKHTHFGTESGYMLQGEITLLIDGQPPRKASPRNKRTGASPRAACRCMPIIARCSKPAARASTCS